jgi:lipopolysaccharide transport system permease protein
MASEISTNSATRAVARRSGVRRTTVVRAPSFSPAGLLSNFVKLAQYRDLLYTLSVHRVKVRYKQSVLGIAWAILQPLSLMLIYTLIFSLFAKMPTSGGAPYTLFVYTALLPWSIFSNALSTATGSLVSHSHLVTKVYFPREILPFTYVLAALFDLAIASTVLASMMIYYRVPVTLNILYVIPIVAVLTVFMTAMSLFLSATQVRFRDIGVAMPLVLQIWMFATPVVYPLEIVPQRVRSIYILNPMVGVIENFRQVALHGVAPDFRTLGVAALVSLLLLPVAYVYFKHVEATVADII